MRSGQNCYATSPVVGMPLFTGQVRDGETADASGTGMDYFGARYYWGALGRFASADEPLVAQDAQDPQSWNLYTYALNNPLSFIDPDGQDPVSPCVNGVDPGTGNICTTATAPSPLSPWLVGTLTALSYVVQPVVQTTKAIQSVAHAVNPMQFQYPSCVLGQMGTWGMTGGAGGAAAGGLGVLAGGVGEFATVPAGVLTGSISGALAGGVVGAIKCAVNSESGGGGSSAKSAKKLSTARADQAARKGGYTGAEDLKKAFVGEHGSRYDLYVQPNGDVEIFAKGGVGEGIETGINIKN
jgi:RHS repeat-associated protein